MVQVQDILDWETEHGTLPEGCCVAMYSGWEQYIDTPEYRNADEAGVMHFPSFGPEGGGDIVVGVPNISSLALI